MTQQKIERTSFTRRYLDNMKNPPEYVDETLPTKTIKIFSRKKQGTLMDPCTIGGSIGIMGSIHFSGSHYDFSPGSYSLRITRRSVHVGSRTSYGANVEWKLRHSREGTVDMIPFYMGTRSQDRRNELARSELLGGPMNPIYAFGPGTLWTYFQPRRGTIRVYSSLEGVF